VHDLQNKDLIVLYEIDDTVPSEDQFSKVFAVELGHDTADARILEERFADSTTRSTKAIAWRTESRAMKFSMS